eukprot:jgi/Bigna1/66979/fgenesh1_pg.2_\
MLAFGACMKIACSGGRRTAATPILWKKLSVETSRKSTWRAEKRASIEEKSGPALIQTIPYMQASNRLLQLYERVKGPDNNVDNIMLAHSLRPHTMEGHMALYKSVLHHKDNKIPKEFLETIGVWVSGMNGCSYCVEHHYVGLCRLVGKEKGSNIRRSLESGYIESGPFSSREKQALRYVEILTLSPESSFVEPIEDLRKVGFDDGEILEINQVAAYFSYANRSVQGLGVTCDGDILGLSPNNAERLDDWTHS